MPELNAETIQSIVELARSTGNPQVITNGNIPFVVIPKDAQLVNLEGLVYNKHAAHPERIVGNVSVYDPDSFIEYCKSFGDETSRAFASEPNVNVVGVLDYHADEPGWAQHRVTLTMRHSEEWKVWTGSNNKQLSQAQFAEFLEQNAIDITAPTPGAMMDVARDLQVHSEVEFGSGLRQSDGQVKFKYTETKTASVGSGQIAVPEQFTLSVPVFIGGPRINMQAFLRYRMKESKLTFFYTLVRPEETVRRAFLEARDYIAATLHITIINGVPA